MHDLHFGRAFAFFGVSDYQKIDFINFKNLYTTAFQLFNVSFSKFLPLATV